MTLSVVRGSAALAALSALLVAASPAVAKPKVPDIVVDCGYTSLNVFAPWHDHRGYTLTPDGGFENGAAGWTLDSELGRDRGQRDLPGRRRSRPPVARPPGGQPGHEPRRSAWPSTTACSASSRRSTGKKARLEGRRALRQREARQAHGADAGTGAVGADEEARGRHRPGNEKGNATAIISAALHAARGALADRRRLPRPAAPELIRLGRGTGGGSICSRRRSASNVSSPSAAPTSTVSPGANRPSSSASASLSTSRFWITRLSGRAPYVGS